MATSCSYVILAHEQKSSQVFGEATEGYTESTKLANDVCIALSLNKFSAFVFMKEAKGYILRIGIFSQVGGKGMEVLKDFVSTSKQKGN